MRILWICNIMLPAVAERLGRESSSKEGWLSGLLDVILERREENGIELHLAFPAQEPEAIPHKLELDRGAVFCYGFWEDTAHAERYDLALENRLRQITEEARPDVVHCFGTEYAHTLALVRAFGRPSRTLVGIQGLCAVYAEAYMADLPEKVINCVTFRDWLKKDSLRSQQQKFVERGKREMEALQLTGHITGRTDFDRFYARKWNPDAVYHPMNETLRSCFYQGSWPAEDYEPRTIFVSQGDYPIKGFHYLLAALPEIVRAFPDAKVKVAGADLTRQDSLKDRLKRSGYGRYLRELLSVEGIAQKVSFLGRLSAEEMKREYLTCGVYVCCSALENSPNSMGEAMLLGVPCVTADVGGIPNLFIHGQDGLLYKGFRSEKIEFYNMRDDIGTDINRDGPLEEALSENGEKRQNSRELEGNAHRLAAAVIEIWRKPDKTRAFCENARLHAKKTHDREQNYRKMVEIYASIFEGNKK